MKHRTRSTRRMIGNAAAPDVFGELAAIEQLAANAIATLQAGHATTGRSALIAIKDRAGGAARDELERRRIAELEQQGLDAYEAKRRAAGERLQWQGFPVVIGQHLPPGTVLVRENV